MVNSVGEEEGELIASRSVQGPNRLLTIKRLHGIAILMFASKPRSSLGVTCELLHVGRGISRGRNINLRSTGLCFGNMAVKVAVSLAEFL